MNTEDIPPALNYIYVILIVAGLYCLVREFFLKPKEEKILPHGLLEPWNIKVLDLALIVVFIFLLVSGSGTLTVEGYKAYFKTTEVAEEHMFIFGFPMHLVILASLFGLFRYMNFADGVPINPIKYNFFSVLGSAFYAFLTVLPLLMGVAYLWPIVLEYFKLPTNHQDLVNQVAGMGPSPMFFLIAFLAVILAPLSEELFFRAFLYRSIKSYTSPLISSLVSSFFFAFMHFNLHSFLPLFLLGFWLCRTYEKSGNIWVPIVLHAFFNGNTLVTLMLMGQSS